MKHLLNSFPSINKCSNYPHPHSPPPPRPYQGPTRKFTLYYMGTYKLNSSSLFVARTGSSVVNLRSWPKTSKPSSKVYKRGKRLATIVLSDRFQDGNEILIISYKASPYFSQLFNATDGRRASKPSTHNTFSFRPRTSLELQENVFLRFYFRKILMQTNGSCFFIPPCQNRFYYLPRLITCCSFSGLLFLRRPCQL